MRRRLQLQQFTTAGSVDDRTPQEYGQAPLSTDRFVINKSRYDSIDSFLSTGLWAATRRAAQHRRRRHI